MDLTSDSTPPSDFQAARLTYAKPVVLFDPETNQPYKAGTGTGGGGGTSDASEETLQSIYQAVDGLEALMATANAVLADIKTLAQDTSPLGVYAAGLNYAFVPANSAAGVTLGDGGGAIGDVLVGIEVTPVTNTPGAITIIDGAGAPYTVFYGGAGSVSNLVPFFIALDAKSKNGGWKVTTGANVTAVPVGRFT